LPFGPCPFVDSKVYFIQETEDGHYEIYFGDGILGTKVLDGNLIVVEYLITNGSNANNIGSQDSSASPSFSSSDGNIAVVHNGIIENYALLKSELESEGHRFNSQTDTEVLSHLIDKYHREPEFNDLEKAVRRALRDVRGAFALVVIQRDEPNSMVVARRQSPLIIGLGKNENFVASDVPAVLEHTRKVIYLQDDEIIQRLIKLYLSMDKLEAARLLSMKLLKEEEK